MLRLFRPAIRMGAATVGAAIVVAGLAVLPANAQQDYGYVSQIIVGRVSSDPIKTVPRVHVLADYLAQHLSEYGIARVGVVVAENNEQMRQMLLRGEVHVLSETAMSALWFEENAGATPLMREWKDGVRSYHVVFVSRRDSGIKSIADLRGKVVAFEDSGSTTGFLAPLAMLNVIGLPARNILLHTRPSPEEVGYVFTDSELNVAAMVERGLVDAGTMSNIDWQEFSESQGLVANLQVFQGGAPLPRSILLAGPELPLELHGAIRQALAGAHTRPADAALLRRYYKVSRYEALSGGSSRDLETARDLYPFVRDAM